MDHGGSNRQGLSVVDSGGKVGRVSFFSWRNAWDCLLGGIGVFSLCMIGEEFYKVSGTLAAPLWPSSGLALALLLLGGWRLFPAISLGTIAATQAFGDHLTFSIVDSLANTLESLVGWCLMTRLFGFSNSMCRIRDIIVLLLAGAPWGTMLSAILCTLGLVRIGAVKPDGIPLSSLLFWTGNVLGILVFTPLVLRVAQLVVVRSILRPSVGKILWFLLLTGVVVLGFDNRLTAHSILYPLAYLSFPMLVWLAVDYRKDVTFAVALVTTMATAFTAFGKGPLIRYDPMATYAEMTVYIMIYSVSCLILMAAMEESQTNSNLALDLRLNSARKESELRHIRTSLNPHFLFNSLNTIKSLTSENPEKAKAAIVCLSEILRSSLRMTRNDTIILSEELALIRSYLEMQQLRFGERLACEFRIDPTCELRELPPMLLHQLVENAVKHGVEKRTMPSTLTIEALFRDSMLFLRVSNQGILSDLGTDFGENEGLGLQAIREELSAIYGGKASFSIHSVENGTVLAELGIPCAGLES